MRDQSSSARWKVRDPVTLADLAVTLNLHHEGTYALPADPRRLRVVAAIPEIAVVPGSALERPTGVHGRRRRADVAAAFPGALRTVLCASNEGRDPRIGCGPRWRSTRGLAPLGLTPADVVCARTPRSTSGTSVPFPGARHDR